MLNMTSSASECRVNRYFQHTFICYLKNCQSLKSITQCSLTICFLTILISYRLLPCVSVQLTTDRYMYSKNSHTIKLMITFTRFGQANNYYQNDD